MPVRSRIRIVVLSLIRPMRVPRVALSLMVGALVYLAMPVVLDRLTQDPTSVSIDDLGQEIDPKKAIRDQCPASVEHVGHLDGTDAVVTYRGIDYERWRVVPKPGHLDRVLLNFKTGEVICP